MHNAQPMVNATNAANTANTINAATIRTFKINGNQRKSANTGNAITPGLPRGPGTLGGDAAHMVNTIHTANTVNTAKIQYSCTLQGCQEELSPSLIRLGGNCFDINQLF